MGLYDKGFHYDEPREITITSWLEYEVAMKLFNSEQFEEMPVQKKINTVDNRSGRGYYPDQWFRSKSDKSLWAVRRPEPPANGAVYKLNKSGLLSADSIHKQDNAIEIRRAEYYARW